MDNKNYGDAVYSSCEMRCFFSSRQNQNLSLMRTKMQQKCDFFWLPYKGQIKNQGLVFLFCKWGAEGSITSSTIFPFSYEDPCVFKAQESLVCQLTKNAIFRRTLNHFVCDDQLCALDLAAFQGLFPWETLCTWFSKKLLFSLVMSCHEDR